MDEMHQYYPFERSTICGIEMSGRNYARYFRIKDGMWKLPDAPEYDRKMCEGCATDS